ncbi:MAG: SpoIIE family protein phosphatase [Ignavibacteriae bacterium]|nr:SpoIIE family protein phosphatase [Ignavibacteria bacterium]MBI3365855.1 SpoIIE family protein phosphatase [Ignavibacteriota bacterium]
MDTSLHPHALRAQLDYRARRLQETIRETPSASARLLGLLQEVESALERIDSGNYGICDVCNDSIEPNYIRAYPMVTVCLGHLSEEQQRAVERDLQLASQIQGQLLPPSDLKLDGYEFAYRYEPVGPVSGDYCDILKRDDGTAYLFLGDVMGKGVSASLLMTQLHAIFHSLTSSDIPLPQLIERANRIFSESTLSTHFATLVCGRISPDGMLEIVNAGHNPPLLLRHGVSTVKIAPTGFPIGLVKEGHYEMERIKLSRDDTLFLYTDGLTEGRNPSEEEFGEERLISLLDVDGTHHRAPHDIIQECRENFTTFSAGRERLDDLTMLVLKRMM